MRALHRVVDSHPLILDDPFATRLLGLRESSGLAAAFALRRRIEARLTRRLPSWFRRLPTGTRRLRAQVVVRSRFAEERLEESIGRGVEQYVVLAAGLDTFALRRPDLAGRVAVLEVDHPETQGWKERRLSSLGEPRPPHLELVAYDFERQNLEQALAASSLDRRRPAFLSWLGVTYYLSREAIADTLRFVASLPEGSEVVFDYWRRTRLVSVGDLALIDSIRLAVRGQGEPMRSFFEPAAIRLLAEECGLSVLEDMDAAATQKTYLAGRRDGLLIPEFAHLARLAR